MNVKKTIVVTGVIISCGMLSMGLSTTEQSAFGAVAFQAENQETERNEISPYDWMMRQVGEEEGIDWRFLSAVAYAESGFIPEITSNRGARGLMQIMPSVARHFEVPSDELEDPLTNIRTGAKLLKNIESQFRFGERTSQEDRLKIMLAAYNAGIGHVMDARRVAANQGVNYNSWAMLEDYLYIKGTPEWVNGDLVRNGTLRTSETTGFVRKVMRQYQKYTQEYI